MHPDYERSRWWAGAENYLAMAHFQYERRGNPHYVWYLLVQWAYCMEELKEKNQ